MLENNRCIYTGGNFSKMFGKNRREIGDLIYDHDLTNSRFSTNLFCIKICNVITA